MQSQQSWRALPQVLFICRPHTSPSGSQPLGLLQVPMGGLVPRMMLQVTEPSPGRPFLAPPQQSVFLKQMAPATRQPAAGAHTWPPTSVGAHTWLQQVEQPTQGSPSSVQLPPPPPFTLAQVPAIRPIGIAHRLLQQSVLRRQMSPMALHPPPCVMQMTPWQVFEQQSAL